LKILNYLRDIEHEYSIGEHLISIRDRTWGEIFIDFQFDGHLKFRQINNLK